jgi:thymidylate synthase
MDSKHKQETEGKEAKEEKDVPQQKQEKNIPNQEEVRYLDLMQDILTKGQVRKDRTKVGTMSMFGCHLSFSLINYQVPLLTTKKMFLRGIFEELMWFLRGQTNSKILESKKVNIWKGNSSREFLDNNGFKHLKEGDCGPIYGFHLRHWNAKYIDCETDYKEQGVDQLAFVMQELKTNPDSRRAVITFLNPSQFGVLPPCHQTVQFETEPSPIEGQPRILSAVMFQRSADMFLGVPFNIASYSLWIMLMAHHLGFQPGRFYHHFGNCHIYNTHVNAVNEQIRRKPYPFPKLFFKCKRNQITDYDWNDLELQDYQCHSEIKAPMAV